MVPTCIILKKKTTKMYVNFSISILGNEKSQKTENMTFNRTKQIAKNKMG